MKRFVLFAFIAFLTVSLFATDKKLYNKKTNLSSLEMFETSDTEYKYFIQTTEYATDDENDSYVIFCNDENEIKDFLVYLVQNNFKGKYAPCIAVYETKYKNLKRIEKKIDIDSKRNKIYNLYFYVLD